MALIIICVAGPESSGKTNIIREFTARHLKYKRAKGDALGIFPMPLRRYAVGVAGSGDNPKLIKRNLAFLRRFKNLRVMIVASRSRGKTFEVIKNFAESEKATLHCIRTEKLNRRERDTAISTNVSKISRLMPRRVAANSVYGIR
jgi:hypothetical protein